MVAFTSIIRVFCNLAYVYRTDKICNMNVSYNATLSMRTWEDTKIDNIPLVVDIHWHHLNHNPYRVSSIFKFLLVGDRRSSFSTEEKAIVAVKRF